ncbi:hypothetical protein ACFWIQ_19560 [Kitasatospora sp. NPDC127059]|uniref:hypothetical protein n=1 Tax=unclassified Kitasatospora TaxID=2633591 RepID=UPI003669AD28
MRRSYGPASAPRVAPGMYAEYATGPMPRGRGDIRRLLLELNAEGRTILLVTHDIHLAANTARRTIELVDVPWSGKCSSSSWP